MKLLTKEILKKTPAIGAQDGKGEDAIAYAKFFDPCGGGTWYMSEYDPTDGTAFGKVCLYDDELGYFNVNELAAIKGPLGLGIERDLWFKPTPLKDCKYQ